MSAPMEVEFTLTEEEQVAVQLHCLEQSPMVQRARRLNDRVGIASLAIAIGMLAYFGWPAGHGLAEWIALAGGLAGGAAGLVWLRRRRRRDVEKRVRTFVREGTPPTRGKLSLSDEGVFAKSADRESLVQWSGITRVERLPTMLLLWYSAQGAMVIPRRAFGSPADADAFEREARGYWEKSRLTAPAR